MKLVKRIILSAFLSIMLLLFLNVNTIKAEEIKAIYTIESISSVKEVGAPKGSSCSYYTSYTKPYQLTKDNYMQLTIKGYQGAIIKGLTLNMKSNKSGGAGYISVIAGNTIIANIGDAEAPVKFNSEQLYGAWSADYVDVEIDLANDSYVIQNDEEIVIKIYATTSSLYCQNITILYDDGEETNPAILPFKNLNTLAALRINYNETNEKYSSYYTYQRCYTQSNWEGRYLIVYEADRIALDGNCEEDMVGDTFRINKNIQGNYTYLTDNSGYVDIKKVDGGYTIQGQNGLYFGATSSSSATLKLNTEPIVSDITKDGKIYYPESEYYLQYNAGTNTLKFKYYKGTQKDVVLYKLTGFNKVSESNFEINSFSLKFSVYIPKSIYESISALDGFEEIGIELTSSSGTLPSTSAGITLGENITTYSMTLSNLNVADLNTIYKAQAYVSIGGKRYYAKKTAYTIKEIATYYDYNMATDSDVRDYLGIIRYVSSLK